MKQERPAVGIDVIATIVGLLAILLPAAGFLVREIAFKVGLDIDASTNLALGAPIGLLTLTGFWAAVLSGSYIGALPFYDRLAPLAYAARRRRSVLDRLDSDSRALVKEIAELGPAARAADSPESGMALLLKKDVELTARVQQLKSDLEEFHASDELQRLVQQRRDPDDGRGFWELALWLGRRPRGWTVAVLAGTFFFGIGAVIFVLPWPIGGFGLFAWVTTAFVVPWQANKRGRVTPGIAGLSIAWVLLLSAIGLGLAGGITGQAVGDFRFASTVGLPNGLYVWLGQSDQATFVNRCGTGEVVSVRTDAVEHVAWSRNRDVPNGPTPWQIIWDRQKPRYGYRPNC